MGSDRKRKLEVAGEGEAEGSASAPTFGVRREVEGLPTVSYKARLKEPIEEFSILENDRSPSHSKGRKLVNFKREGLGTYIRMILECLPDKEMNLALLASCGSLVASEASGNGFMHTHVFDPINAILRQWKEDGFNQWQLMMNLKNFEGSSTNFEWFNTTSADLPDERLMLVRGEDGKIKAEPISILELEGKVCGVFVSGPPEVVRKFADIDLAEAYKNGTISIEARHALEQANRYLHANQDAEYAVVYTPTMLWVLRMMMRKEERVEVSEAFTADATNPSVKEVIFAIVASSIIRFNSEKTGSRNWLEDRIAAKIAEMAAPTSPSLDEAGSELEGGSGMLHSDAGAVGGESGGDELLRELDDIQPAVIGNSVVRVGRWRGEKVAVKVVPNSAQPWVKEEIGNESRKLDALKPLQGSVVPEALFTGKVNGGRDRLLVTKFVEGKRLDRVPKSERLAGSARSALQELHNKGYLHGDVMPRNIVVKESGRCVFLDLGRTKRVKTDKDKEQEMAFLNALLK